MADFPWDPDALVKFNASIDKINKMPVKELDSLLRQGKCPYPVEHMIGVPLGMFHCNICGTMVVAGMVHPELDTPWEPDKSMMCQLLYEDYPELKVSNETPH